MNPNTPIIRTSSCFAAFATIVAIAASLSVAQAQTPMRAQIAIRPLTPQDIKDYSLPADTQVASGLSTVGIGQPVHFEAWITNTISASNILSVNWVLTARPLGSAAALAASPLAAAIPTFHPADRLVSQVAGRAFLRPDLTGQYTVAATISTTSSGTTNLSRTITAGTYMGINTCALCHSGGVVAPNMVAGWSQTGHATKFTRDIDGGVNFYNNNCVKCHTVGYDAHVAAVNGGFDDIAAQHGWTVPAVLTNGNWAAMPAALKNVANVQCENCHGPGSEHAYSLGDINRISTSLHGDNCAQCHDSKNAYPKIAEWKNSRHAVSPRQTGASCVRCHNAKGFANYLEGKPAVSLPYAPIGCATCHDPHDATNPHQLRAASATLYDGTVLTQGGKGTLCMNCHQARANTAVYVETAAGSANFGPHNATQADMLAGVNAVTYGKTIPSSAHLTAVQDTCVTCHMQKTSPADPAFTHAGGHTWNMRWDGGEMVNACQQCHGQITTFDFPRQDFDGNGIIEGVQTEVRGLKDRLGRLLPPLGSPDVLTSAAYTRPQLRAAYNWKFVNKDGSFGVHNLAYTVGILKASIADLTDDANNDGLPDSWQIQYFGSLAHPNAAPNAAPAGDGVPNWLKYALGLDPTMAGMVLPDGVVWANARSISGGTDTIQIFTAAEVVFNTEAGKTYQLQAISTLGGGWQNVGDPVTGTGGSFSFVTPTRNNVQQFYRVAQSP
jgi:predicted CXXCH cytochrome family protein